MSSKINRFASQILNFYNKYNKHPRKRLYQIRYVLNTTLSIIGLAFLDKEWRFNALIATKLIITVAFVIFCLYTIWYFIDQSVIVLQVFCCQGVFLPVISILLARNLELLNNKFHIFYRIL